MVKAVEGASRKTNRLCLYGKQHNEVAKLTWYDLEVPLRTYYYILHVGFTAFNIMTFRQQWLSETHKN